MSHQSYFPQGALSVSEKKLSARILGREQMCDGFLRVYRYEFQVDRHRGGTGPITWEIMERGNTVAVLGYDPKRDEVVLVNEFRPGALIAGDYPYRDNLVAGVIEQNETPIDAAVREMQEEAGLELRNPSIIHPGAYVSSGGTSEKISLVYGTVDTTDAGGVHGSPDEREDILVVVLPAEAFIERIRRGDINDLKTIVAGYWFAEHRTAGDL
jgi:ADP-ribose pyrophosphatase